MQPQKTTMRSGFTLITSLAFTLVVGTVLAGVGTVAMSHYSRSRVEGNYANIVSISDAGINWELARISSNITDTSLPDQWNSPRTVSLNTLTGMSGFDTSTNFKVHVRAWGSNCDGSATWTAPADMCIESTGTYHGISRTVRAHAQAMSVFGEYAIYAYNSATFNGTGQSQKDGTVGNMGTNGPVDFNGVLGTGAVGGLMSFNGPNSQLTKGSDAGNTAHNPDPVIFPSIAQIANSTFSGGLSWLATHNNNANVKVLKSTDPTLSSEPTVAGLTLTDVNSKLVSAGYTVSSRSFGSSSGLVKDTSTLDLSSTGTRFVMPGDQYYTKFGLNGDKPIFFPPGDYYVSDLNFGGTPVFLTHLGQVRIWVDSTTGGTDDISKTDFFFTDTTPSKFRLYYNKCGTIKMRGHALIHGGIYGIKPTCNNSPELNEAGGDVVYGSVIMNVFTVSGGSKVIFPNDGGSDSTDAALWYGFKDHWQEVSANTNPVFVDGTSH